MIVTLTESEPVIGKVTPTKQMTRFQQTLTLNCIWLLFWSWLTLWG